MLIGERIRKLRKTLDITQREFGERINLKPNSVALIEGGRNTSDQTIAAIVREFKVNEEWLRTGNGEMFMPMDRNNEISDFVAKLLKDESDTFKRRFVSMLSRLDEKDWETLEKMALEMFKD